MRVLIGEGLEPPDRVRLDLKNRPIQVAAIDGKANFLLTGDRRFSHI